jgi:hypothetical protein
VGEEYGEILHADNVCLCARKGERLYIRKYPRIGLNFANSVLHLRMHGVFRFANPGVSSRSAPPPPPSPRGPPEEIISLYYYTFLEP